MDYYKTDQNRIEKKKRPEKEKKRFPGFRMFPVLVLILIAAGAGAILFLSDRLDTRKAWDMIVSALPGKKPVFYHIEVEKNGQEYLLRTTDVLTITYRDEFVIRDVSTSALVGWVISVDLSDLGVPDAGKVLLRGTDIVDRVMKGEGRDRAAEKEYRIRIVHGGEMIASIPVRVEITPQDWLRMARGAPEVKSQIESLKRAGEMNRGDPQVHRMLAKAYLKEGLREKAAGEYQKILRQKPDDLAALAELAQLHIEGKKYKEAAELYGKVVKLEPGDAAAHANLAFAYEGMGHWDAAKAAYHESLRRAPDNVTVRYRLGEAYDKSGQTAKAAEQFKLALKKKPGDTAIQTALAASSLKAGKYDEAIGMYMALIRKNPRNASLHANLGLAYGGKRRISEEIASYRKALELNPKDATIRYNLAAAYEKQGKSKEAFQLYESVLKLKPDDPDALAKTGDHFIREKKYGRAVQLYERAVKRSPKDPMLMAQYAYALGKMRQYREAASGYEKALKLGSRDPQVHYNLAYTYEKLGETQKAVREYEQYAAMRPTMETLSKLADHYLKSNQYSGAVKAYERMIKLQPRKASLHAGLGYVHGLRGDIDSEIDSYKRALRYDRNNDDIHLKLGAAYEKKNMFKEALAEHNKAYKINPESKAAARKIPQLKIRLIREKHKDT